MDTVDKSLVKEINKFPMYAKDFGVTPTALAGFQASMTPNIVEERQMNVAMMDVFSRLMMDRIIWAAGPVDDRMSTIIQAQLMFLDDLSEDDITIHIDTPGGSVKSGLSIVDVMHYINSDTMTVNTGMCASMGSVLLGAGTKGKRLSLKHSTTMLHRSSGGLQGNIQDAEITYKEWQRTDAILFKLLAEFSGKTPGQVKKDSARDLWLSAEDAIKYGLVDELVLKKK